MDYTILTADYFNELAKDIHINDNRKWWFDKDGNPTPRPYKTLMMLVISEIAEAMEGLRKDLMDDKLPHRKMFEVELADAVIRLLDAMEGLNLPKFDRDYGEPIPCPTNPPQETAEILFELCKGICEDALIEHIVYAIFDLGVHCGLDILGAIEEKRAFNRIRVDHTYEARAAEGGKAF